MRNSTCRVIARKYAEKPLPCVDRQCIDLAVTRPHRPVRHELFDRGTDVGTTCGESDVRERYDLVDRELGVRREQWITDLSTFAEVREHARCPPLNCADHVWTALGRRNLKNSLQNIETVLDPSPF